MDFELNFSLGEWAPEQLKVFYSNIIYKFCTLENSYRVNVWNIEGKPLYESYTIAPQLRTNTRLMTKSLFPSLKSSTTSVTQIAKITEIDVLGVWLVLTSQNVLLVYNLNKKQIVCEKVLSLKSIVKFIYSHNHKALVVVCKNSVLPVFEFKQKNENFELKFINNLTGHVTFIVDADYFEQTSMLASVDENCVVKIWNLENLTCSRTVELEGKVSVKGLFLLRDHNKISIVTRKINVYELEHNIECNEDADMEMIVSLYYCEKSRLYYIFKKTELLFLKEEDGSLKSIYKYNKKNEEAKSFIVAKKILVINEGNSFYLTDSSGNLTLFNVTLNAKSKLVSHALPVDHIYRDSRNNMVVTVSPSEMLVHTINPNDQKNKYFVIKKIENIFDGQTAVKFMEINMEFNLIVLGFGGNRVYVIDYEFAKMHAIIELETGENVEDAKTFSTKGFLMLLTSLNRVIVLEYSYDQFLSGLKCNFEMISMLDLPVKPETRITSCLFDDQRYNLTKNNNDVLFCIGFDTGETISYNFNNIVNEFKTKTPYYSKNSFNARRYHTSSFNSDINNIKTYKLDFNLSEAQANEFYGENLQYVRCTKGGRQIFEKTSEFQSFKSMGTLSQIVHHPDPLLVSCDNKYHFKVQTFTGEVVIMFDVRQPLPMIWDASNIKVARAETDIYEAVQVINHVNRKIITNNSSLKQVIKLNSTLKALNENDRKFIAHKIRISQSKPVLTMKDLTNNAPETNFRNTNYNNSRLNRNRAEED